MAKFEVVGERRGTGRLNFARFEQDLAANLKAVAELGMTPDRIFRKVDVGRVWVRPKSVSRRSPAKNGSSFISVPEQQAEHPIGKMDVRVILEPSPEFALSEVVWLRAFGPALDALLTPACRANRLNVNGEPARISVSGRKIFKYWVPAYRSFRQAAFEEARKLLHEQGRCTLAALDLTSYFDRIDPRFLIKNSFIRRVEQNALARNIPFNRSGYLDSTRGLLEAFVRFRSLIGKAIGAQPDIGIPIGSLTARLIANVALCDFDKIIASGPGASYYGRYVDDVLIVQAPSETPAKTLKESVSRLLPPDLIQEDHDRYVLNEKALGRAGSRFEIQAAKLRVFDLEGPQGLEYLGAIENELEQITSERRRFLDPRSEHLRHVVSASPGAEPIRALREADALSLRKLAVTSVCEKVVTAAAMLSHEEASRFSRSHLGRIGRIATDWSRWVDLLDHSVRILAAALTAGDIETADEVLNSLLARVESLADIHGRSLKVRWGEHKLTPARARKRLQEWIRELLIETICSAAPFNEDGFKHRGVGALDHGLGFSGKTVSPDTLLGNAKLLASSDLRWTDRETQYAIGSGLRGLPPESLSALESEIISMPQGSERMMRIQEFRGACRETGDPIYSGLSGIELLLLYRPPSYADIMLRWLRDGRPLPDLVAVVNAVRGTNYTAPSMTEADSGNIVVATGTDEEASGESVKTQLILGNLCTEEEWWKTSLTIPTLSVERQGRLSRVLNQAIDAAGRAKQKGVSTLLVLPELSLPRRWLREVVRHVIQSEPSLSIVAGVEYDIVGKKAFNEAIAVLPRPYMSAAGWIWTKRRPAHHEAHGLRKEKLEFSTRAADRRFVVLHSEHGRFLSLICSELLEVDSRSKLLGRIDLLLVPAWNQDITSFEALVHSTALELHSFVGVANNGIFSDCRVRGPYADPWRREASRLISPNQNETVVAELHVGLLRAYRSDPALYEETRKTHPDWPGWKPMPPGMAWPTPEPGREPSETDPPDSTPLSTPARKIG